MKLVNLSLCISLTLLITGCELKVVSNPALDNTNTGINDVNSTPSGNTNLIDLNPISDNSDNTGGDNTTGAIEDVNSSFDIQDAIKDPNACNENFYDVVSDSSFNGDGVGENGSDFVILEEDGLNLRSEYLEGDPTKQQDTTVSLFYKRFPSSQSLDFGTTAFILEGVFQITYDIAWVNNSEIDNTIYVLSFKTDKPSCYRLKLNKIDGTELALQKVYR